jgi:hypothetical protein
MKENHGFDKVGYVPPKKSDPINFNKAGDTLMVIFLVMIFLGAAVALFIYPGYFMDLFSETGYKFMN